MYGPKSATRMLRPTIAAPTSPIGFRHRRDSPSRRRDGIADHGAVTTEPTSAPSAAATPAASRPGCSSPSGRMMLMGSLQRDPRVEDAVQDVHHQVDEDER